MPLACCNVRYNQMNDPNFIFEEPRHSENCRFCEECGENCPWPRPGSDLEKSTNRRRRK